MNPSSVRTEFLFPFSVATIDPHMLPNGEEHEINNRSLVGCLHVVISLAYPLTCKTCTDGYLDGHFLKTINYTNVYILNLHLRRFRRIWIQNEATYQKELIPCDITCFGY